MMTDEMMRNLRRLRTRVGRTEATPRLLYLENTYTPTYVGGTTAGVTTYAAQIGQYWHVGSFVYVIGQVAWTNATGTGNARISLPLAALANATGNLRLSGVTFANSAPEIFITGGDSFFIMDSPLTNAAPTTVAVEVAGNVIFSLFYKVV